MCSTTFPIFADPARAQLKLYRGGHMFYIDPRTPAATSAADATVVLRGGAVMQDAVREGAAPKPSRTTISFRSASPTSSTRWSSMATLRTTADREQFRQICKLLAAVYHYEYFDRLEKLRTRLFYFNPELDTQARFRPDALDKAYAELTEPFVAVLKGANFVEVTQEEIERAHREDAEVRIELKAPVEDFREVRFFRRGHHNEDIVVPRWFGWCSRTINASVYDDVVLFVALKPEATSPMHTGGHGSAASSRARC